MAYIDEKQLTLEIGEHYCKLLDSQREQLSLYLSDNVVLEWFGRTIGGKDQVVSFFIREMVGTTHKLTSIEPTSPAHYKGKRDVNMVASLSSGGAMLDQAGVSAQDKCVTSLRNLTVEENPSLGFEASGRVEFCRTKKSPASRNLKLAADTMKWERYCKIHVTYNFPNHVDYRNNFEISHIRYIDNLRCRRNLAAEFDKLA